ncbi:MAG: winged helix-turn-helix transcriptional regulator [Burkholderiaceae bacterium]|nr:winged helix-turn-helix transcriptional regulator [Burkholderiaceae bacterium]
MSGEGGPSPAAEGVLAADSALDLGTLRDVLGFHVTLANITTVGLFERHVGQPFALRKAEYSLLMLLLANGSTPAKRLARTLRLSAPAFTMLIDRMQDKQWLRRERNPADRRSQLIVLSADGQALARRAQAASKTMEASLQRRLSRAERAMLIELLAKLSGHRDDESDDATPS